MTDTYSDMNPGTLTDERDPADLASLTDQYSAHNYHPLPVVAATAEGVWVTDVAGRRYLDMLAGYSALNFGHRHPRLVAAAMRQLERVTLVSRAFDHDQFGPFCAELAELCGMDMVLPMNTGAEAVETAIKVARKWGYVSRGVPADQAIIVVFDGNFHGRTTTIVSFSSDPDARDDFGPYTPGFVSVPYGDLSALTDVFGRYGSRVVGVLVEPIQGEAGVVVPPPRALPSRYASGITSSAAHANVYPVRPSPDWISSAIIKIPFSVHSDRIPARNPGGGTTTPASPWIGSTSTATTRSPSSATTAVSASRSP